jgi:hypothetical protein
MTPDRPSCKSALNLSAVVPLNRNYGFGVSLGDCADEPELRDLTDQPARLSLRRRPVEMVWPEVVVEGPVTQHVVSGGQDGSGDGADGLLGSPSIAQALKLGLQIAGLFLDAGPGALHHGGFQPGRALAHLVGAPLAGTLVVAWAERL